MSNNKPDWDALLQSDFDGNKEQLVNTADAATEEARRFNRLLGLALSESESQPFSLPPDDKVVAVKSRRGWRAAAALAALVLLSVSGLSIASWFLSKDTANWSSIATTATTYAKPIIAQDGSSLLPQESARLYRTNENLHLLKGTVLADIQPQDVPLQLQTRELTVDVLGTRFLLSARDQRSDGYLATGSLGLRNAEHRITISGGTWFRSDASGIETAVVTGLLADYSPTYGPRHIAPGFSWTGLTTTATTVAQGDRRIWHWPKDQRTLTLVIDMTPLGKAIGKGFHPLGALRSSAGEQTSDVMLSTFQTATQQRIQIAVRIDAGRRMQVIINGQEQDKPAQDITTKPDNWQFALGYWHSGAPAWHYTLHHLSLYKGLLDSDQLHNLRRFTAQLD